MNQFGVLVDGKYIMGPASYICFAALYYINTSDYYSAKCPISKAAKEVSVRYFPKATLEDIKFMLNFLPELMSLPYPVKLVGKDPSGEDPYSGIEIPMAYPFVILFFYLFALRMIDRREDTHSLADTFVEDINSFIKEGYPNRVAFLLACYKRTWNPNHNPFIVRNLKQIEYFMEWEHRLADIPAEVEKGTMAPFIGPKVIAGERPRRGHAISSYCLGSFVNEKYREYCLNGPGDLLERIKNKYISPEIPLA